MRRVLMVAVVCWMLVAVDSASPHPAGAVATLSIAGNGYGHGIGMSQYGARDRAQAGHTYSQILAAYYPGTTVSTGYDTSTIRVRVESDADNQTTVRHESGLRIRTSGFITPLPSTVANGTPTQWRLRLVSGVVTLEALVGSTWRPNGNATITSRLATYSYAEFVPTDATVQLLLGSTFREYVGWVRGIRPSGATTSLRSVVYSTFADYLPSVVAAEMPSSWATHALRAQAVAARTYALHDRSSKPTGAYYDTCDTTSCQVFNGRADYSVGGTLQQTWATASTIAAVHGTWGRHLTYQGSPAFTQFSASNGGHSVAGSRPYLIAAPDSYDRYPTWQVALSASQLEAAYPAVGTFTGVTVNRDGRGPHGGRVLTIRVIGTSGSVSVTGAQFRTAFGLRSTLFGTSVSGGVVTAPARDVMGDEGADAIGIRADGTVHVWVGTGAERFASRTQIGGGFRYFLVRTLAHDLSGSGLPEIVYVQGSTGQLVANPIDRSGRINARRVIDSGTWTGYDLIIGVQDWDGTGLPGLLARDESSGHMYHFPGDGSGGLGPPRRVGSGWGDRPIISFVGDWNGDGTPDLVTSDGSGRLWLYPNNGTGAFDARQLIGSSGWNHRTAIVGGGDWDRDGYPDFLSTSRTGELWLHRSDGSGLQTGKVRLYSGGWDVYPLLV